MTISLSKKERKLVKSLRKTYADINKKKARKYHYNFVNLKDGGQPYPVFFTSSLARSVMRVTFLLLKLYGANIQYIKKVDNLLTTKLKPDLSLCEEQETVLAFHRAYQSLSENPLHDHECRVVKWGYVFEIGTIQTNNYENLLERLSEYVEAYKDIVFSFEIAKPTRGGTLTTITLKD